VKGYGWKAEVVFSAEPRFRTPKGWFAKLPYQEIYAGETPALRLLVGQDFFPSPSPRAGMEEKKEESPPRVPFGHPGLEIRHPLRGLGGMAIASIRFWLVAFL